MENDSLLGFRLENHHLTNESTTWGFDQDKNTGKFLHWSKGSFVPSDQCSPAPYYQWWFDVWSDMSMRRTNSQTFRVSPYYLY